MKETYSEMVFPNTIEEYFKDYAFIDEEQIYTNGSELIPTFRVKQWEEHKDKEIKVLKEDIGNYVKITLHDRKEIERLNNELELQKLKLEEMRRELTEQDKYIDKLKIEYDKELAFERQIKREVREYIEHNTARKICGYGIPVSKENKLLEILDKVGGK